jgi:hypothetical protein
MKDQTNGNQRKWTEVPFRDYFGKTLPQVILSDPDFFFWAFENGRFYNKELFAEAKELALKGRSIKLPEGWRVDYFVDRSGTLCNVEVVEDTSPKHEGSTAVLSKKVLDLSVAHSLRNYDKKGSKILLTTLRGIRFGPSRRLTRAVCEAFFNDDGHFAPEFSDWH